MSAKPIKKAMRRYPFVVRITALKHIRIQHYYIHGGREGTGLCARRGLNGSRLILLERKLHGIEIYIAISKKLIMRLIDEDPAQWFCTTPDQ